MTGIAVQKKHYAWSGVSGILVILTRVSLSLFYTRGGANLARIARLYTASDKKIFFYEHELMVELYN